MSPDKISPDRKSCVNCTHCGAQLDPRSKVMSYVCRLKPGTAAAAFMPGPNGVEVKVVTTWPPVTDIDWCSEFTQRLAS